MTFVLAWNSVPTAVRPVQALSPKGEAQPLSPSPDHEQPKATKASLKQTLEGGEDIWSVAYSPDGRLLASADFEGLVVLWDLESAKVLRELYSSKTWRWRAVAFSPDGKTVAAGGRRGVMTLWDAATGAVQYESEPIPTLWNDDSSYLWSLTFSPDGKTLAASISAEVGQEDVPPFDTITGYEIRLWDTSSKKVRQTLKVRQGLLHSLAFSPDGRTLVSAGNDRIWLWNVETGTLERTLDKGTGDGDRDWQTWPLAFSPDGSLIVSNAWYDTFKRHNSARPIRLWEAKTGRLVRTFFGAGSKVCALAFSPDGTILAGGNGDGSITLWDPQTGRPRQMLQGHTKMVRTLRFSPDGTTLTSGSADGTIKQWGLR